MTCQDFAETLAGCQEYARRQSTFALFCGPFVAVRRCSHPVPSSSALGPTVQQTGLASVIEPDQEIKMPLDINSATVGANRESW